MSIISRGEENLSNQNESFIQRPLKIKPWTINKEEKSSNFVWIHMKARKIINQFSKVAGEGTASGQTVGRPTREFKFLAPLSLNENIVHHWDQYESVASRLAQKVRSAVKLGAEGAALAGLYDDRANLSDAAKNTFKNVGQGKVGTAIESVTKRLYQSAGGSVIPRIKVDTPLYYQNSDRRQIVLEFLLFHEGLKANDPRHDLINPIQDLMRLSSPDLLQDKITIEFPYMWEVFTWPVDFIHYTTCALVGVQPTWNSPYVNGVPVSVNLQLTFTDMSPLYRETIDKGSIVNIISSDDTKAKEATTDFVLQTSTGDIKRKPLSQG